MAQQPNKMGNTNPYDQDPYLKRIKMQGGAYAILLAFRYLVGLSLFSIANLDQGTNLCCRPTALQ
jgi:hypothetical protein